jgi:DNA segregation ATPase FtsK/SpoIIIE-like protein
MNELGKRWQGGDDIDRNTLHKSQHNITGGNYGYRKSSALYAYIAEEAVTIHPPDVSEALDIPISG